MELLIPDANQKRPTSVQARAMCHEISLEVRPLSDVRLDSVLDRMRETHANGGALFASFDVGPSEVFDWFASRNLLLVFGILRQLLDRVEVGSALAALEIKPSTPDNPAFVVHRLGDLGPVDPALAVHGIDDDSEFSEGQFDGTFQATSPFLFDGELALKLYDGGAYPSEKGNGRTEKENALAFCDALFGLRLSEVSYYETRDGWTPWFGNIGCDWTAILFDRRARTLSILTVTDSD